MMMGELCAGPLQLMLLRPLFPGSAPPLPSLPAATLGPEHHGATLMDNKFVQRRCVHGVSGAAQLPARRPPSAVMADRYDVQHHTDRPR